MNTIQDNVLALFRKEILVMRTSMGTKFLCSFILICSMNHAMTFLMQSRSIKKNLTLICQMLIGLTTSPGSIPRY